MVLVTGRTIVLQRNKRCGISEEVKILIYTRTNISHGSALRALSLRKTIKPSSNKWFRSQMLEAGLPWRLVPLYSSQVMWSHSSQCHSMTGGHPWKTSHPDGRWPLTTQSRQRSGWHDGTVSMHRRNCHSIEKLLCYITVFLTKLTKPLGIKSIGSQNIFVCVFVF